jgi:hypothetical protein
MTIDSVADSLSTFLNVLKGLKVGQHPYWFRGQGNEYFGLTPGALRKVEKITNGLGNKIKRNDVTYSSSGDWSAPSPRNMLDAFKREARPFF